MQKINHSINLNRISVAAGKKIFLHHCFFYKTLFLICLLSINSLVQLCAQVSVGAKQGQQRIDSLTEIAKVAKNDTIKVNLLNEISLLCRFVNGGGMPFATQGLQLSRQLGYRKGEAESLNLIGLAHYVQSRLDSAKLYYDSSLQLNLIIGNKMGEAHNYLNYGRWNYFQSNLPQALAFFYKALAMYEVIGNKPGMAQANNGIGLTYHEMNNDVPALSHYQKALHLYDELGDKLGVTLASNNIGEVYRSTGNLPLALQHFQKGANGYMELGSLSMAAMCFDNIGRIYTNQRLYKKAIETHSYAISISTGGYIPNNQAGIGFAYLSYLQDSEAILNHTLPVVRKVAIQQAINYLGKAESFNRQYNKITSLIDIYKQLSEVYSLAGNYRKALEMHLLHTAYKDSVFNEESSKKIGRVEAQAEYEKKQLSDSLLNMEAQKIADVKLNRQITLTYASVIVGILLLAISILIYFYYKQLATQKQKNERLRLSRDLHDDIGSTLSSIGVYSKIAADKLQSHHTEEAFAVLDKMNSISRGMADQMNELVWNINPDNDTLQQTIDRMKLIAGRQLQPCNILYSFNQNFIEKDVSLTVEQKKNLLFFYKEALNNIIKYAGCQRVDIDLLYIKGLLTLTIKDDGAGFDTNQHVAGKAGGNGLKNMKARMQQLNGSFQINSEKGKGTSVTCSFAA